LQTGHPQIKLVLYAAENVHHKFDLYPFISYNGNHHVYEVMIYESIFHNFVELPEGS
jgi:hypothetical protein